MNIFSRSFVIKMENALDPSVYCTHYPMPFIRRLQIEMIDFVLYFNVMSVFHVSARAFVQTGKGNLVRSNVWVV